jgi:hypothetical protein
VSRSAGATGLRSPMEMTRSNHGCDYSGNGRANKQCVAQSSPIYLQQPCQIRDCPIGLRTKTRRFSLNRCESCATPQRQTMQARKTSTSQRHSTASRTADLPLPRRLPIRHRQLVGLPTPHRSRPFRHRSRRRPPRALRAWRPLVPLQEAPP